MIPVSLSRTRRSPHGSQPSLAHGMWPSQFGAEPEELGEKKKKKQGRVLSCGGFRAEPGRAGSPSTQGSPAVAQGSRAVVARCGHHQPPRPQPAEGPRRAAPDTLCPCHPRGVTAGKRGHFPRPQVPQRRSEPLPPVFFFFLGGDGLKLALFASPTRFIPPCPSARCPPGARSPSQSTNPAPTAPPWSSTTPEAPPQTSQRLHPGLAPARGRAGLATRGSGSAAVAVAVAGVAPEQREWRERQRGRGCAWCLYRKEPSCRFGFQPSLISRAGLFLPRSRTPPRLFPSLPRQPGAPLLGSAPPPSPQQHLEQVTEAAAAAPSSLPGLGGVKNRMEGEGWRCWRGWSRRSGWEELVGRGRSPECHTGRV